MEIRDEILLRKYDAALKAAEDCRKREVSLINYSILIYGAIILFAANQPDRMVKLFAVLLLCVLMGIIGLYIGKLNVVELKHLEMEKGFYGQNGIPLDDYKNWPFPGLNKRLIWLTYLLLIFCGFVYSLYIIFGSELKNLAGQYLFCWKTIYVVVFLMCFVCYGYYFNKIIAYLNKDVIKNDL